MLKLAFFTSDAREAFRDYGKAEPYFGTAPTALLHGFAQFPDEVEVHVVCCVQRPLPANQKLARNISYHSLLVPKAGWLRTGYQGCVRAIRRWIKGNSPHLVHGQGTERDCAISAVLSGIPNLLTIHGNMRRIAKMSGAKPFSFDWLTARLEGWVLPRTQGVVCITRHTRDEVRSLAKRTWVVPNAVDASFYDVRNVPVAPAQVLCVANVMKVKNQSELIRALDPVAKELPFTLVFLGKVNPQDSYAQEFLGLVGQRSWCQYRGFADREALKSALSVAAALVLPSLEENCPMSILEAMAVGVPVVAANVGGVPDLIEDGVTGLFCDPSDPGSMRSAVGRYLLQPAFAREVAVNANRRAQAMFRPEVIAKRHLEIYREVLRTTS